MNQYKPTTVFPPGETLAEILEERCMTQTDLAGRSGITTTHINEIIKGKAKITPNTAASFENIFQIPVGFWLKLEQNYQEFLTQKR